VVKRIMELSRSQEISLANLPSQLELDRQAVHVWCVPLNLTSEQLSSLAPTLSADEQTRASRFRFERDRHWFIAGRGMLRLLLSRYLRISPEGLLFTYSDRGKPALSHPETPDKIAFNVSHSNGIALYGVTCDRPIGVDIEYIRSLPDLTQLAQRYFLPSENALLQALPPDQQQNIFFRLWTGKEAYLKATGEGITGLKQVEIALEPGETIVNLKLNNTPATNWTVMQLNFIPPGYVATLAVEGRNLEVAYSSLLV
jgi:4'-phosphopantetheinyl transferase